MLIDRIDSIYDSLNRLDEVYHGSDHWDYGYNEVGSRASLSAPDGSVTTYQYNSLNRLTQLKTVDHSSNILLQFDYTLDDVGNRTGIDEQLHRPGGELDTATMTYAYDDTYRLLSETRTGADAYTRSYTYDAVENRETQMKRGDSHLFLDSRNAGR